jgi:hypothetical protein
MNLQNKSKLLIIKCAAGIVTVLVISLSLLSTKEIPFFAFFSNNTIALTPCYLDRVGSSDSLLQIDTRQGDKVAGQLVVHNAEKDSSFGTFTGLLKGEKLNIDYKFWSEGVLSTRSISYLLKNGNLIGEGFVYKPVKDCKNITYLQGLSLIPYKVKLPLHLFSQIRLSFQDQSELIQRVGSKELLPIENVIIEYRPEKGDSVNLAYIYLWNANVWPKVQDPNSPPDFGKVVKAEKGYVLTANLVQDCVYPDKVDCENITELYEALTNVSAWTKW